MTSLKSLSNPYTLNALGLGVITGTAAAIYMLTRRTPSPPAITLHGAQNCKYILDDSRSHTFLLPGGRKLGYADYGDPHGRVVLFQHGLPGSRIEATRYHDLGKELGIRVISIDRPGYGWSSPVAGYGERTVKSWAEDVSALAEHLDLNEYAVMGVSGGGPYALALAHCLPKEKVKAVCIVCGIGPSDIGMRGAGWPTYLGFTGGWRYSPQVFLRWYFEVDAANSLSLPDEERLALLLSPERLRGMSDIDRPFYADEDDVRVYLAASRQSFAQGYDAMCKDGYTMCVPWGFVIEDVRKDLPVVLWYGTEDRNVPPGHGRAIASRLRTQNEQSDGEVSDKGKVAWRERVRLRMLEDSHASISMRDKRGYLIEILQAWDAGMAKDGA